VPHLKLIHTIKKATKVIENLGSGTGQAQNLLMNTKPHLLIIIGYHMWSKQI
jgi:hypothetical protein